jgi:hypothetical protein
MHEHQKRIADAYDKMPHDPNRNAVRHAYNCFCNETVEQFIDIQRGWGWRDQLTLLPWRHAGQPYESSQEMFECLDRGMPLYFFTGGDLPKDHPLAGAVCGVTVAGLCLTYNDCFRAVHDILGHYLTRSSWGPAGEETAYQEHKKWYSPLAQLALQTETQGQNCWVNFGKHLRRQDGSLPVKGDTDYVLPSKRPYAQQKANLISEYL